MGTQSQKSYFVTGIGTDVGKSVVSAILVSALNGDYFKPVQAGELDNTDTQQIESLVRNANPDYSGTFHPEQYRLGFSLSPHISAKKSGIEIEPNNITLPKTDRSLIVEGAGGLFVPLTDEFYVFDLISALKIPVVVVSRHYLGSINHTILTLEALVRNQITVAAVIFNGDENSATESVIQKRFGALSYYRIPTAPESVTPEFILGQSQAILPFISKCLIS